MTAVTARTEHRLERVETSFLLNRETGMVLPAVLLLFVFQVSVMTTPQFATLHVADQILATASLLALALGAAGLLTPSAYGRATPRQVSGKTLRVADRAGRWPLAALALKFATDVYLEARLVTRAWLPSIAFGVVVLAMFTACWFVLPLVGRRRATA